MQGARRLLPSGGRGWAGGLGTTMAPSHLSVREMREDEKPLVLEILKAGIQDTENRVALHALTRPPALLLLAAASSGLRFVLASFALALLLPVFLAVAALKLGLRARWGSLPPPGTIRRQLVLSLLLILSALRALPGNRSAKPCSVWGGQSGYVSLPQELASVAGSPPPRGTGLLGVGGGGGGTGPPGPSGFFFF
uniref:N-acetyltransferase 14 isoform X3 n=1 Tax=Jaculus jaculus TaxID=51337 RepID=UPI001E1B468B|nr:N-acetyltransferase 14 isoform X3 [Jaculus jaculus]